MSKPLEGIRLMDLTTFVAEPAKSLSGTATGIAVPSKDASPVISKGNDSPVQGGLGWCGIGGRP